MSKEWNCVRQFFVNGKIPIVLYSSLRNSLTVFIAKTPGPMVSALFSFVTETVDDDGLPHTLEHLNFKGSVNYPYNGVLDKIANVCMASGTNAFTADDHTGFELTTVGPDGFLKVLPVYMDHILNPLLLNEHFITEVHHINGSGEDGGVVYSEMQEIESEMSEMVSRKRKELFYPECHPYRVETGGRIEALRKSCSIEKIRNYHRSCYNLSNMVITICGTIDPAEALKTIGEFAKTKEETVVHKLNIPFQNCTIACTEEKEEFISCPCDDERYGMVEISWNASNYDMRKFRMLRVIGHYLSYSAASPLQRDFVQCEDHLASSVSCSISEHRIMEFVMTFTGVPCAQLLAVKKRLFEKTLKNFTSGDDFDSERMTYIIQNLIESRLSKMETNCHNEIFKMAVSHQIFGNADTIEDRFNYIDFLKSLVTVTPDEWVSVAAECFNSKSVCVCARPSAEKVTEITKQEDLRLDMQRKNLGVAGLTEWKKKLDDAVKAANASKVPTSLLVDFTIAKLSNLSSFSIQTLPFGSEMPNELDILEQPITVYIHSVKTFFVEMSIIWDTSSIDNNLRFWLMIYLDLVFESPATIDGKEYSYEDVSKLYTRDLVSYSFDFGVKDHFARYVTMTLKAVPNRYMALTKWFKTFIVNLKFELKRVSTIVSKLIADAGDLKRDGDALCNVLLSSIIHKENSNDRLNSVVQLEAFHKHVQNLIKKEPAVVIETLEKVRKQFLLLPRNLHIACDASEFRPTLTPHMDWLFKKTSGSSGIVHFEGFAGDSRNSSAFGKQRLITVGSCESSYLLQCAKFDHDWESEETMSMLLLATYLSQTEGPLWNAVRGPGSAYGVMICVSPDDHLLSLVIDRASRLEEAYECSKRAVLSELEGLNTLQYESAKRILVHDLVERQGTVKQVAWQAVLGTFRNIPLDFTEKLCEKIWVAKSSQILDIASPFIRDLFNESKSSCAVAVHPTKFKTISKYFKSGNAVNVRDLMLTNYT